MSKKMQWNYNMTDYIVYYQKFDPKSDAWDYQKQIFNSESKAKNFGAEILKVHPKNGVMIKSKEYKIIYHDDNPMKKYIGNENFLVNSTPESHKILLDEIKSRDVKNVNRL